MGQSASTPYPNPPNRSNSLTTAALGLSATTSFQGRKVTETAHNYGSITTCYPILAQPSASICYKDLSGSQAQVLSLMILNGSGASCIEPSHMLLWFVFYNVFTVVAGLISGTRSSRQSIARCLGRSEDSQSDSQLRPLAVNIFVSFLVQLIGTIATAFILTANGNGLSHRGQVFGLWAARPFATPLVIWLTMIRPREYNEQATEVAYADTFFSFISSYAFGAIAKVTNRANYDGASHSVALRTAEAGSALGFLALLLLTWPAIAFVYSCYLIKDFRHKRILFWTLPIHALRYLACWLLWSGVLLANDEAFCPHTWAIVVTMFLWLLLPLLDNILRGWIAGRTN